MRPMSEALSTPCSKAEGSQWSRPDLWNVSNQYIENDTDPQVVGICPKALFIGMYKDV